VIFVGSPTPEKWKGARGRPRPQGVPPSNLRFATLDNRTNPPTFSSFPMNDRNFIDRNLLQALAILAKANGRSLVAELNEAVATYLAQELPDRLGEDGTTPLVEDRR